MATDQYHESASDLTEETKDVARVITSMIEEAEAINWYEQRIAASKDEEVKGIIRHSQEEEMEHFAIELAWLVRKFPKWKEVLEAVLFKEGDILENVEEWEEKE